MQFMFDEIRNSLANWRFLQHQRVNRNDAVHDVVVPSNRCYVVVVGIQEARAVRAQSSSISLIDAARHDEFVGLVQLRQLVQAQLHNRVTPERQLFPVECVFLQQNLGDCFTNDLVRLVNFEQLAFVHLGGGSRKRFLICIRL